MKDTCLFCGTDVTDLGTHVCKSCSNKGQAELLSDKLKEYQHKLNRVNRRKGECFKEYGELPWYKFVQRNYLERIIQLQDELILTYMEIIDTLEMALKRKAYETLGGNAEVERSITNSNKE